MLVLSLLLLGIFVAWCVWHYRKFGSFEALLHDLVWWTTGALFFLLLASCFIVAFVGMAYLVKPLGIEAVDALHQGSPIPLSQASTPFLSTLAEIIKRDGKDCLAALGPLLTGTGLFLTAAGLFTNRLFSKNIEIVKTMNWCHTGFHDLGLPESTKPLDEKQAAKLVDFYQCEYHFYIRGLLPALVFIGWMEAWKSKSARWEGRVGIEIEGTGDPDFKDFCNKLQTTKSVGDLATASRKEWQRNRYGHFAPIIRFIDSDHRSGWSRAQRAAAVAQKRPKPPTVAA